MGFCNVTKEGKFSVEGDLRVLYTTMMVIRNLITNGAGLMTILATRIGLRYAFVRRQFKTVEGQKVERPLIDYQTHMSVYGPLLARSFSI